MRLTKLHIDSLPGFQQPLHIDGLGAGVNVVLGPNASGKSSLIRALLAVLYPGEHSGQLIDAEIELTTAAGLSFSARRLGDSVAWLREGEPHEAPRLPAPHLVGTYVLRLEDLLGAAANERPGRRDAPKRPTDRDQLDQVIAHRLDQELSGGIDLKAVRKAIGRQAEKGQRLAGLLRDSTTVHAELRRGRAELQREESRLGAARAELTEVRAQAARAHLVSDATGLLQATQDAAALQAELAAYPPQLTELLGNEAEEYAKAAAAADQRRRDLHELDELISGVEGSLAGDDSALPTVSSAELHLEQAERLVSVGEQRSRQARELAGLEARHGDALRRLGGQPRIAAPQAGSRPPSAVRLDNEALEKIERLLDQRQLARAELHGIRRQLEEMSRLVVPDDDDDALLDVRAGIYRGGRPMDGLDSPLRAMRSDLVRWLHEPLREPRRPDRAWGVALGLTVATVVAAASGLPSPWPALLGIASVAWLLVIWLFMSPPLSPLKERLEADVIELQDITDVPLPENWDHASIADVILDIDDEIARRDAAKREAEHYDRQLRDFTGESQLAQQRVLALEAELDAVRAEVGYGVAPDIGLTLWLQAAREVEVLNGAMAGTRAQSQMLERLYGDLHERLDAYLGSHRSLGPVGLETAPGSPSEVDPDDDTPLTVRAGCRELLRLAQNQAAAVTERERLQRERQRVASDLGARLVQIEELAARAKLTPPAREDPLLAQRELAELLALLPARRAAEERLTAQRNLARQLSSRLADDEELLNAAVAHDHQALEAVRVATVEAAERQQGLARFIHRTERDVEHALSERRLQRAAADVQVAADELSSHRSEALDLVAAEFMLDVVVDEHQVGGRPAALERAAAWFSKFTADAYALTFESATGGASGRRLGARDNASGRNLALAELSTGTRAQLLLASRLAFALETEVDGVALPFFLDEALTTSDEQRFKQVASAVLRVAKEEARQFIYLSARADDAELWQEVASRHGAGLELIKTVSAVARG